MSMLFVIVRNEVESMCLLCQGALPQGFLIIPNHMSGQKTTTQMRRVEQYRTLPTRAKKKKVFISEMLCSSNC